MEAPNCVNCWGRAKGWFVRSDGHLFSFSDSRRYLQLGIRKQVVRARSQSSFEGAIQIFWMLLQDDSLQRGFIQLCKIILPQCRCDGLNRPRVRYSCRGGLGRHARCLAQC